MITGQRFGGLFMCNTRHLAKKKNQSSDWPYIIRKINIDPWRYSPLRARAYQQFTGFTSSCTKTGMKAYLVSLGNTSDQERESPSRCWVSRIKLPLQISSYSNYLRFWCALFPYTVRKFPELNQSHIS